MGSGAFLVAACRFLADHVVAAWTREGKMHLIADVHDDVANHARRLVAQRCLYGVDKNRYAVQLARMSLWLITMARREPFTFVDHALRHGDSLVGLSFDQIRAFHWKPEAQQEASAVILKDALAEAVGIRQEILSLAGDGSEWAQRRKQTLLLDAEDALERARLVGDLVIGAFFAHAKDKDRERERKNRLDMVGRWIEADNGGHFDEAKKILGELYAMQAELKKTQVPFHWMVEFPEVFFDERPDPLDGNRKSGKAFVEAFVGNPPFMGGRRIRGELGDQYTEWLGVVQGGSLNADLSARFFLLSAEMTGEHGTIGLVATNTIGQGDTLETGLDRLVNRDGWTIYDATVDLPWPGDAAVTVSVANLAKGHPLSGIVARRIDGVVVANISSSLRPEASRVRAAVLVANGSASFQGCVLAPNAGFVLDADERERLVLANRGNADRIWPFLGGEEVNTSATHAFDRYAIYFAAMTLEEASRWPDLLRIVEQRAKPIRDNANREAHKKYWWHFADKRPALYAAIAPLSRCLVTARVTKHLCFSFQPTDRIFNEKLYVFPLDRFTAFAVLQSRVHTPWVWLLSSTMKTDLNYSASDCFATFPFPQADPRTVLPAVESAGEALYEARAAFMVETNQGLTKTYNALKDPDSVDPRVLELRRLHEAMDRAVLDAYGWSDLEVPPYCAGSPEDKATQKVFEDAVVDRLFALNAVRAAEEAKAGGGAAAGGKGKAAKKKGATGTAGAGDAAGSAGAAGEGDAAGEMGASAKVGRKKKDPGPRLPGMG